MKLITRDTDYAIRALSFIAKNGKGIISVEELIAALKIPRPFLRKILQILSRKKLLKSYKGKKGGFRLALPPDKISLVDLMKVFQGPSLEFCEHVFRNKPCPNIKECKLKSELDFIEDDIISRLQGITLESLL